MHCVAGVQAVKAVSEPTSHELWGRGAGCLKGVATYLPETVLQGYRMFKRCRNLPAGHCVAGVQAVEAVSEPTCQVVCCRGAGCLSGARTYLPGTVLQGCRMFKQCCNLSVGTVFQGYRMCKPCQNLPAGHFVAEVQDV